jgi:hypothetical protein
MFILLQAKEKQQKQSVIFSFLEWTVMFFCKQKKATKTKCNLVISLNGLHASNTVVPLPFWQ